ncbi:matrixin family metalloprotease [Dyella subtropica]|uniref:matrixin family metalloprotease n=1 Tax=Dyella subtropica TaxID=2992127 RepID=UPI002250D5A1|nr:matrixin family metalloprotease [Dyella subtropica]
MSDISPQLQAILNNFQASTANDPIGTQTYNTLMQSIQQSQPLLDRLNANAINGSLGAINFSTGTYTNSCFAKTTGDVTAAGLPISTIELGSNYLSGLIDRGIMNSFVVADLIGHENYHVFYAPTIQSQYSDWVSSVKNYFANPTASGTTPDLLLQQHEKNNDGNEAGAMMEGFNAAAAAYMKDKGLTSLTAGDIGKMAEKDAYVSYLFRRDGTPQSGIVLSSSGDGTIDTAQSLAGAIDIAGQAPSSGGNTGNTPLGGSLSLPSNDNNQYYGDSALRSLCQAANGQPFQINYAQDGLLYNTANPASPLTTLQADTMFAANAYNVSTNTSFFSSGLKCTIVDTGTGHTSSYNWLQPGAAGNGNSTDPSLQVIDTAPAPSAGIQSVNTQEDLQANGTYINSETLTTTTGGAVSASVDGSNATVNLSGATITDTAGSSVTVRGANNTITSGNGATTTIQGNNDTDTSTGGVVNISAGDTGTSVTGNQTAINAASGVSSSVYGSGNMIDLQANSNSTMGVNGSAETVNSTGNNVVLGANTNATVNGVTTVNFWSGGSNNSNVTLTSAGDTVNLANGDSGESITGTGDTINGASSVGGCVYGSGNTIDLLANSNASMGVTGSAETVNSTGNYVVLGGNTNATVNGVTTVNFWSGGSNNSNVTLTSAGATVNLANGDSGESITGTGDTINGASGVGGCVYGSGNTIDLLANSNSSMGVTGSAETVNSTGNYVVLGGNTNATVNGVTTVNFWSGGSNNSNVTLTSAGDTVNLANGDSGESITGTGDTINGASGVGGCVYGSGNTIDLLANSNTSMGVTGSAETVNSTGNYVVLGGNTNATVNGVTTVNFWSGGSNNSNVTLTSAGATVNLANGDSGESVTGTGDTINGASGVGGCVYGSGNTIDLLANSNTSMGVTGSAETVNSTGNYVVLGGNTNATVNGVTTVNFWSGGSNNSNVTLTSAGATVNLANGDSGESITGTGDTINGASGVGGSVFGSGNTIDLQANSNTWMGVIGSAETVNSTGNYVVLGGNTNATVNGVNTVNFWSGGSNNSNVTLTSAGDTVDLAAGDTGETINGSSEHIVGAAGDSLTVIGADDTFNAGVNDALAWNSTDGKYTEDMAFGASAGLSNEQLFTNANGAATEVASLLNNASNGESTVQWYNGFNLPQGYSGWAETFSGQNAGGELLQEAQTNLSNYTADINYYYDSQGQLVDYSDTWFSSAGVNYGTVTFDPWGDVLSGYDSYSMAADPGAEESDGFYGLAGDAQMIQNTLHSVGGGLTSSLLKLGNASDLATAGIGLQRAAASIADALAHPGSNASPYENAHWYAASKGQPRTEITWSAAGVGGPFSGSLSSVELAAVEQAFDTWGKASGIHFREVADASQAEIRVGLGQLDTVTSGVAGYTECHSVAGMMRGAEIYLEDPGQDALVGHATGEATYTSTDASFEQAALHEIGHALGLASNTDAHSIMYYALTADNRTLDATDVSNIQSLYGHSPASALMESQAQQLVQAMASFDAGQGAWEASPMMPDLHPLASLAMPASSHGLRGA